MSDKTRFDVIVVGIGGMGSATCYQLAKRGRRVLGLEQFDIPHNFGSSHGQTRIIRLAYYEDPSYVPLLRRAYKLWAEIEQAAGERLFVKTGSLDAGLADDEVFTGSLASCLEHDIPHEVLTGAEIRRRFPGYQVPDGYRALFQADGGFLLPERAIVAFVNETHRLGGVVRAREAVTGWTVVGDSVTITTTKGRYHAGALVFTAGAWNTGLLPLLDGVTHAERQVLAWLQPAQPDLFTPERFPVYNMQVGEERYYGFPVHGIPGFKFGKYHHRYQRGTPADFAWEADADDEALLRAHAAEFFPAANGPTMALKVCMFTNSPDEHFIIGRHPDHPQVSIAAGFSGHGYKFASVIGEIMADLATEGHTRHDISRFDPTRFGQKGEIQNM